MHLFFFNIKKTKFSVHCVQRVPIRRLSVGAANAAHLQGVRAGSNVDDDNSDEDDNDDVGGSSRIDDVRDADEDGRIDWCEFEFFRV